jgi:hypothetical protein
MVRRLGSDACWLNLNGFSEGADEDGDPILAGYMDGGVEQAWECATLRGDVQCAIHGRAGVPK